MLGLALLMSAAWLSAQQYPQTGSSQNAQTGSSQSASASSGQTSVRGCLQESNGSYMLTSDSGMSYQLQGDTSMLSKHVGHEVQITGTPSGAGSASSAMNSNAGASTSGSQQMLTVGKVKHISKTCTNMNKTK
jgi:hypothetical protein